MTKEEELITRWIDGELNPKEKIEFEKLYDARPDFYNSLSCLLYTSDAADE